MENPNRQTTYLVVDGENIDATLGLSVLDRRPNPEERPRWDRVLECAHGRWGQKAKGLFFLNGSSGFLPMGFVQALTAMDYSVIPLSGPVDMKVVDVGLQRTMDAIAQLGDDINLRVKQGDVINQINLSPDGVQIDGKFLHVTGDTKFERGVIAKNIEAGSIQGDRIVANSIGADRLQVDELSAITAKIGTLRTADSGARTEIHDNLILVYDDKDRLRVRMGVW